MANHGWNSAGSVEIDVTPNPPEKMSGLDGEGKNESKKLFGRYDAALKSCLPVRRRRSDESRAGLMPSLDASCFSFLWANWLTGTMWKAWRRGLTIDDIWKLQVSDRCESVVLRLERAWADELKTKGPADASLFSAGYRTIRTRIFMSVVFMVISTVFQFLAPTLLMKALLDYTDAPEINLEWGLMMVGLLMLVLLLKNITQSAMLAIGAHTASRIIGGYQFLAYRKLLEWRSAHSDTLVGQLTNFCANDMDRVLEAVYLAPIITSVPVMFIACMVYAVLVMGAWVLLGILTIFIFYPVMSGLAAFVSRNRLKTVRLTDTRVTLMEEVAANIRLIKMYAWEKFFSDRISCVRTPEQKAQERAAFLQSITMTMTGSVAILAAVVTFLSFSLAGNRLTAPEVFTVLSIFGAFQFSLGILPQTVRVIAEAVVALRRLKELLLFDHPTTSPPLATTNPKNAIEIAHATFAWDSLNWEKPDAPEKRRSRRGRKRKMKATKNPKAKPDDLEKLDLAKETVNALNGAPATVLRKGEGSPEEQVVLAEKEKTEKKEIEFKTVLWDINLVVPQGSLIGLCGMVGCGKSSLISAIAGNLKQCAGERRLKGQVAVVSQQAWIFNDSVKENILFGLKYDAARYKKVVEACCLGPDLDSFPNGDETEIGERGVNLSGGQKQRVSLARAVYADRDIYLLDDCLSAVDPEVAQQIFDQCLQKLLREKTVVLATHSIQLLEKTDRIYFLEDGRVVDEGRYVDLVDKSSGAFSTLAKFDKTHSRKEAGGTGDQKLVNSVLESARKLRKSSGRGSSEKLAGDKEGGKLILDEDQGHGAVSMHIYWAYFKRWGNTCTAFVPVALVFLYCISRLSIPVWLQWWIDNEESAVRSRRLVNGTEDGTMGVPPVGIGPPSPATDEAPPLPGGDERNLTLQFETASQVFEFPETEYQLITAGLTVLFLLFGLGQGYVMCRQLLVAASRLHMEMLATILRAPISFFDSTPTGRILSRFSRDVDELDVRMPFYCNMVSQGIVNVLFQLLGICIYYYHFTGPCLVLLGLFICLDHWLNVGVREVKRLDNVTRSFVLHHIGTTVSGLPMIHSYNKEKDFEEKFASLVNHHTSAILLYRHTSRWFQCRLELLGNLAILATSLIVVLLKGSYSSAVAGVALNFIFQSCGFLPFLLRIKSEFQARMTSVERMVEYIEDVPQEAPAVLPRDSVLADWPSKGEVKFDNYCCRYRPNLPLVLRDVNLRIEAGEKVGIVGRTGAGKSSLIYALLRLIEPASGAVVIDGVDTTIVGIKRLRESIAVIPQDPTLFRGTIRSNLDPFNEQSDDAIWQALERAHLQPVIKSMGGHLDSPIGASIKSSKENGSPPAGVHFSVGQRQLLCLARALLKNSKILVLDEATASVDVRTDALIQETLRTAFASATVLTIAHRLHTVLHYDKILVMENGCAAEYGKPTDLMSSEKGIFRALMATIGITSADQILDYSPENLPWIDADEFSSDEDQYLSCGTEADD